VTLSDIKKLLYPNEIKWYGETIEILIEDWGAVRFFAEKLSMMLLINYLYNNPPTINSVWRSSSRQDMLRARWDRGERAGLVARPANNSRHTLTNLAGQPSSQAADLRFPDQLLAADIAKFVGIDWIGPKDEVHFRVK